MSKSIAEKIRERRRFPRIKDNIFVLFQSMEREMSFEAITNNISQGGLMFRTSNFIAERTELLLEICQPLNSDKDLFLPMSAKVQIAWIRKVEDNDEYLIGAKITKMDEKNQKGLSNYISNRLKSK